MGRPFSKHTAQLARRIVELRDQSWKWDDIGRECGVSGSYANQLWKRTMAEIPVEKVHEARERACRLADDSVRELLELARDADNSTRSRVDAYNGIKGWEEHRAKMLGTYAPVKSQVQVISEDMVDAEIRRLTRELGSAKAPADEPLEDGVDAGSPAHAD